MNFSKERIKPYDANFIPQGFNNFHGIVHNIHECHIYYDSSSHWRVRGFHGDYGLFKERIKAIECAIESMAQLIPFDELKIFVHSFGKHYPDKFIINRVKNDQK